MTKEYIEREALLDEINIAPVSMSISMNVDECKGRIYERERLVRTINDAPAADVVEVVRCKECIHRPSGTGVNHDVKFPDDECPCKCPDTWYSWMPPDDWYCASGKRKDGGQDDG